MKSVLLFFSFFLASIAATAEPREELQVLLHQAEGLTSLEDRMEFFSESFLGLPYGVNGPLGEGMFGRFDQDPLYRFDTFDCTTFVETVLALSSSWNLDQFEIRLNAIRYENGDVDYLKRNHFTSLQWVPNNVRNGTFVEINSQILPDEKRKTASATIDFGGWLNHASLNVIRIPDLDEAEREARLRELKSYSGRYSPVIAEIDYLPISELLANPSVLSLIPNGSVVNFVRPNWDLTSSIGTHLNVSHQGLVFQKNGLTILRHASSGAEKKVMEVPLIEYLSRFENHPTLKGIHLLLPVK